MDIRNLKLGDTFYCMSQVGKDEYRIKEHVVAGLEETVYGQIVKYIENGVILTIDCNFVSSTFDGCIKIIEKNNPEYAVCSYCGKAILKNNGFKFGRLVFCPDCKEELVRLFKEEKEVEDEVEVVAVSDGNLKDSSKES